MLPRKVRRFNAIRRYHGRQAALRVYCASADGGDDFYHRGHGEEWLGNVSANIS